MLITIAVLTVAFATPHELSITPASRVPTDVAHFNGTALTIDRSSLEDVGVGDEVVVPDFPLARDRTVDLRLVRFDVFTDDAEVVIASTGSDGRIVGRAVARPDVVLLRGSIVGEPGSRVFLALGEHTTNGWIESRGSTLVIGKNPAAGWTAIYDLDAVDPDLMHWIDIRCGVDELPRAGEDREDYENRGGFGGTPGDCAALRMAIETDWQFTGSLFSGNTNASGEYAVTLIGAVSTIFKSDVNVAIQMTYLRLWENSSDPWSGGDSGAQLGEFRSYWQANMDDVDRHLAHMLSGQNLGGGVAWVSAVCGSYGYAVSGNLGGSFPLPIEDHNGNNWDLMVVAHETGHNCGTLHTHDYSPPIDGCGLGDCTDAWGSTIMSYCHLCDGGLSNVVMSFHPIVQDTIEYYLANSISCSLGGDGSPPVAGLDTVWGMFGEPLDINVLANDYANDCSVLEIFEYDTTSYYGGTIEMVGSDPSTAVLRYNSPPEESDVDLFQYVVIDESGQQEVGGVVVHLELPRPPDEPPATEAGVEVNYYSLDTPSSLPDFDALEPIGSEIVVQVNYPSTGGNFAGSGLSDDVGAVFEGYIEVPESGTYTLFIDSDDGSRLFIGDDLVADNDGLHGMHEESGDIALAAGLHAIRVEFFERGGGAGCIVRLAGGGMSKQVIPEAMWRHEVTVYGDVTGDGVVDIQDLLVLIAAWGSCDDPCPADLDNNGVVDIADALEMIAAWTI